MGSPRANVSDILDLFGFSTRRLPTEIISAIDQAVNVTDRLISDPHEQSDDDAHEHTQIIGRLMANVTHGYPSVDDIVAKLAAINASAAKFIRDGATDHELRLLHAETNHMLTAADVRMFECAVRIVLTRESIMRTSPEESAFPPLPDRWFAGTVLMALAMGGVDVRRLSPEERDLCIRFENATLAIEQTSRSFEGTRLTAQNVLEMVDLSARAVHIVSSLIEVYIGSTIINQNTGVHSIIRNVCDMALMHAARIAAITALAVVEAQHAAGNNRMRQR